MATTTVIDQYNLDLERPSDRDGSTHPIRAIATNRADPAKIAEAWWGREQTQIYLLALVRSSPDDVGWYMQQLEDHRFARVMAHLPGVRSDRAIFNPRELIEIGFKPGDLEL